MSNENENEKNGIRTRRTENGAVNEHVEEMGNEMKSDVPAGLAVIPKGANVSALARRTTGEILQNEMEYHCMACGWNKSLQFEPDELEAIGGNVRDYTGPCPGCGSMTLQPKDAFWGKDFPSMSALAQQAKRADARVQAEEFVDALSEKAASVMGVTIPKPTISDPAEAAPPGGKEDLPAEVDITKLTPR